MLFFKTGSHLKVWTTRINNDWTNIVMLMTLMAYMIIKWKESSMMPVSNSSKELLILLKNRSLHQLLKIWEFSFFLAEHSWEQKFKSICCLAILYSIIHCVNEKLPSVNKLPKRYKFHKTPPQWHSILMIPGNLHPKVSPFEIYHSTEDWDPLRARKRLVEINLPWK